VAAQPPSWIFRERQCGSLTLAAILRRLSGWAVLRVREVAEKSIGWWLQLGQGRFDINAALRGLRTWLVVTAWQAGQAIRVTAIALWAALGPARASARERFADARWRMRDRMAERAERFRAWREQPHASGPRREHVAYAWWQLKKSGIDLADGARNFRAQHRRASTAGIAGVFLALALAGTGAAILADGGSADAAPVSSTRYVVVTGPTGTRTYAVTVTTKGKKQTILRVVRKPGGGTTTLRDTVSVDGPTNVLPGKTIITKSPPKTVTVKGPAVTVTETETQVLTETVTLINDVTVTVEVPAPPIPSP
jgi:hypothetical protein